MRFVLVIVVMVIHTTFGDTQPHYSRQWAVHIEGGIEVANAIASKHGFVNLGEVRIFLWHYVMLLEVTV